MPPKNFEIKKGIGGQCWIPKGYLVENWLITFVCSQAHQTGMENTGEMHFYVFESKCKEKLVRFFSKKAAHPFQGFKSNSYSYWSFTSTKEQYKRNLNIGCVDVQIHFFETASIKLREFRGKSIIRNGAKKD